MQFSFKSAPLLGLAALGLAGATTARAGTTIFTDRTAFDAAVAQSGASSFANTFSAPADGDYPSVTYSGNGLSYTAVGQGPGLTSQANDVYADGATVTPYFASANLLFNSNTHNIYAFGGDFYALNSAATAVDPGQTIFLTLSDGTQYTFTSGPDASDASAFVGFVSTTPLEQLAELEPEPPANGVANYDFAAVDNLEVASGAPVSAPEPSAFVALGLGALGVVGRLVKARKRLKFPGKCADNEVAGAGNSSAV